MGWHFQHLLAENVGTDQDDGRHHPGHENAGDADSHNLVEKYFRAQQHETGLDEVFHLRALFKPFGRAEGIGNDHADGDGPDFGIDTVKTHGLLVAQDIGKHAQQIHAQEGHKKLAHVEAHEFGADGSQHGQREPQHNQGGNHLVRALKG